ncbi:hypothetical protein D3C75_319020 [compost metagenome]
MDLYDRENDLKQKFNEIWNKLLRSESDYYSVMTDIDFIEMKKAVKNINDIFTCKTTLKFLDWTNNHLFLSPDIYMKTKRMVLSQKSGANGYDLKIDDNINIIAEIKCNIVDPQIGRFKREQRAQIEKDIDRLLNGKLKVKIDVTDYFKFLVFYDFGEETKQAFRNLYRVKEFSDKYSGKLTEFTDQVISKEIVHVVFIK